MDKYKNIVDKYENLIKEKDEDFMKKFKALNNQIHDKNEE